MPCLIAAPASGSGKTLVSLALTALARRRGHSIQTFKVGPDYLDPQLLTAASCRPCRNLDPLLCGEAWVQGSFQQHGSAAELSLVEGVMGLFDGRGASSEGSSAHVAQLLELPVVLVVEASRQAGSVAALVRGFRDHQRGLQLAGVVLNGVGSERHHALLAEALSSIAMPLLGALPRHDSLDLPSRHLGLLPAHELADLEQRLGAWADLAERHLKLDQLWPLLQAPKPKPGQGSQPNTAEPASAARGPVRIAIASDAAFHFRYPEASELLAQQGVEVQHWSPLADQALPEGCQALVLPGGYPELHAAQLAASQRSLQELRRAQQQGLPIYAECGGLLLLGQELTDQQGNAHAMAGLLPFRAERGQLSLGYRCATALRSGLVLQCGEQVSGHEFHRWQLNTSPDKADQLWQLEGWGCPPRPEGWSTATLHASWLHLHWGGCGFIPQRLAAAAQRTAPLLPH
ncbi:cobyrinate a,c-diamide synthase [Vulcanococcus sp. Clear-D1]|uniref:cobyrinate a,c-diamide synthase n=1 Tax=Vulcanococcus sp. Clear-D1 TaxID=2766970 RepID=UPI00199A16C6|nr:cobyrinate a,c-diamide synthase [Vulcanococcus sp. Clear-D1]MBD1194730.1 cobyrinate a,c-diamide synthase [Vulcanococcus sp. Clear-D1]